MRQDTLSRSVTASYTLPLSLFGLTGELYESVPSLQLEREVNDNPVAIYLSISSKRQRRDLLYAVRAPPGITLSPLGASKVFSLTVTKSELHSF